MKAFFEHRAYSKNLQIYASVVPNMEFAAHWHSDIELIYVIDGSLGVGINMQYKVIHSGDFAICGSNDIHYYKSIDQQSRVLMMIFKQEMLDPLLTNNDKINPHSIIYSDIPAEFGTALDTLVGDIVNNDFIDRHANQQLMKMRVLEIFLAIFRYSPSYYLNSLNRIPSYLVAKPVQTALKYIEENYAKDISLDLISEKANLSPYYFSRLFKKTTGTSFKSYLNHIRLSKAAEMIGSTPKRILDIAYETGFGSIRTFNRAFYSMNGYPPTALRK